MKHPLGKRLLTAARFVRQGAYFADIGTDHAYLPLFLLSEGIIERAVCADINEGPLNSAKKNAEEQGFSDKILFRLTDGAAALSGLGITDYAICGMGGELIARIIDSAPHLKADGIRLILQPMTRQAHLREYLAKSGFRIIDEGYSAECSRYYLTILCEYDGVCRKISDFEAELGNPPPRASFSPEMKGYFDAKLRSLKKIATAKRAAGEADNTEEKILLEYERRM